MRVRRTIRGAGDAEEGAEDDADLAHRHDVGDRGQTIGGEDDAVGAEDRDPSDQHRPPMPEVRGERAARRWIKM